MTGSWLRKSAELGWFAMMVPEADGGGSVSDAGLLDAAIIAEQVGRFVQPGPFIPLNVAAAAIAAEGSAAQREALLPAMVMGEQVVTWAFADSRGNWDAGAGLQARTSNCPAARPWPSRACRPGSTPTRSWRSSAMTRRRSPA
jgi:alkylation response protein AidB-like acyl-CoA dehydrogenase